MRSPWTELDEEPVEEIITGTVEGVLLDGIDETDGPAPQVFPRGRNGHMTRSGLRPDIDDDEPAITDPLGCG